ncbi:MAG: sialidase family protein [bacterium]
MHDKLSRRLGWMTRTQPLMISRYRMMLGLYHDVFACSLAAFTEDWGQSWTFSEPIQDVYLGMVQPSFAKKLDGTLVAFMRDNGYPKQIRIAESKDQGITWSSVRTMDIPNPGSSVQCLVLRNGHWIVICNDTKKGRRRMTTSLSENEGATWKWRRAVEDLGECGGEISYPTLIQAGDGSLHCTYSCKIPGKVSGYGRESIKHVHFDEGWIKAGEPLN